MSEIIREPAECIWTPSMYVDALQSGQHIELPADSALRGRILRGREEAEFDVLGSPERDVVFIMGPDGLSAVPGMEPLAALDKMGFTPNYVQGRIAQGYHFRLLVFEGGDAAPLATWDNALSMVAACHPDLQQDIEQHRTVLGTTPFEVWQARAPESLEKIDLAGIAHPDYMSLDRYRGLSAEDRSDPLMLRRLLFHVEHLNALFHGDGYTRTPDGQVGLAEYLVPNGRIQSLPEAITINFL